MTGHLDFSTSTMTATSVFNLRIVNAYAPGLNGVNLVGDSCVTAEPVSVTMTGPVSLFGSSTVSGTFTRPDFQDCGLSTTALNLLIPGPGNTFTAVASPPT